MSEHHAIGDVVFHDQHPHTREIAALRRGEIVCRMRQAHGEPESRARTEAALTAHFPAHHLRELTGNSEPEPGPAEAACRGVVRLREWLEQTPLRVRGYADARVFDGKMQARSVWVGGARKCNAALRVIRRIFGAPHFDDDFAVLGELDG